MVPAMKRCPYCKKDTQADLERCEHCGKPLTLRVKVEQFAEEKFNVDVRLLYCCIGMVMGGLITLIALFPFASFGIGPFVTQGYLRSSISEVQSSQRVAQVSPTVQAVAIQPTVTVEPSVTVLPTRTPEPIAIFTPSPTSPPTSTPPPTDTPVPTPIPTDTSPLTQLQTGQTWRQGGMTARIYTYDQVVDSCEGSAGATWNIWAVWRIVIKNETDSVSNIELAPNNFEARDGSGRPLKLYMMRDEAPGCSYNPYHPGSANVDVKGLGPGEEVRIRIYGIQDPLAGASFRFIISSAGPIENAVWELPLKQ